MTDVPLRSIFISDFRRLEGHRTLPLDAPVVLMHGPNGAGKTSVLSALELSLTGEIRSMRRHDPRYTAHLPFHGQEFATIRVDVSDELASNTEPVTMTVGGARVEGSSALSREAAQFYTERCYLDQVSLGQLLELYQYRAGKEESALARFVNELLGLEQLDALRTGLSDAVDIRRLRKLCEPLAEAEGEAQRATAELSRVTKELESARELLARLRAELSEVMGALGFATPDDDKALERAGDLLRSKPAAHDSGTVDVARSLTALGGRIGALSNRPSVQRLEEAKAHLGAISEAYERWSSSQGAAIESWRTDVANLGLDISAGAIDSLDTEILRIRRTFARQDELREAATELSQQAAEERSQLQVADGQLSVAQEEAGSLAEGLAALREHATDNVCPVCDREFSEVSSTHLTAHVDLKIAELTSKGAQLRRFRQQRDATAAQLQRTEQALNEVQAELWSEDQLQQAHSRRDSLTALRTRLQDLQPMIAEGRELQRQRDAASSELVELEAASRDADFARSELERLATMVDAPPPDPAKSLEDAWRRLNDVASDRLAERTAHKRATDVLAQSLEAAARVDVLRDAVAECAELKFTWDERVSSARRRQAVAKAVHEASSKARASIVQRVFTESLNDVWRSVFTRLAPREPFVPAFGIPTASRTALELTLETVHVSGEPGGSPQMMLSAGNLNTAALSLFIALHLAVEPLVPCLVLDDPVQSMDEVHVAQFAGLIRVLSKHHGRQVIIAVHERELFQYLALELSPAFQGDELITIELGSRADDEDHGIIRHTWSPDSAIAV